MLFSVGRWQIFARLQQLLLGGGPVLSLPVTVAGPLACGYRCPVHGTPLFKTVSYVVRRMSRL
ncbi:hypothetical protein [Streptomyces sp. NPDC057280]|uniref:hypothetical protein n=1 Tax=Streptomyces sp. NPDC057280 TaxID=3346081 RepID=UPI003634B525